jgi:hypothetical protein
MTLCQVAKACSCMSRCVTAHARTRARTHTHQSSSFLAYGPYSLTGASLRMIALMDLLSAFFLHLSTPIDFRSFSVQSYHFNFGLPASHLPSGFPRNTFLMVLSSDILTLWPAHSSLLTFIVVKIFGFLHIACNSSLVRFSGHFYTHQYAA